MDLEAIPRDSTVRARLLQPETSFAISEEDQNMAPNTFAVDRPQTDTVIDINNPPRQSYRHQEYPKMVYHHTSGHVLVVNDGKEHHAAAKAGFEDRPDPSRSYYKVKSGFVAPPQEQGPTREEALSLEDEDALTAADLEEAKSSRTNLNSPRRRRVRAPATVKTSKGRR